MAAIPSSANASRIARRWRMKWVPRVTVRARRPARLLRSIGQLPVQRLSPVELWNVELPDQIVEVAWVTPASWLHWYNSRQYSRAVKDSCEIACFFQVSSGGPISGMLDEKLRIIQRDCVKQCAGASVDHLQAAYSPLYRQLAHMVQLLNECHSRSVRPLAFRNAPSICCRYPEPDSKMPVTGGAAAAGSSNISPSVGMTARLLLRGEGGNTLAQQNRA